jgi:hypothetical protein
MEDPSKDIFVMDDNGDFMVARDGKRLLATAATITELAFILILV